MVAGVVCGITELFPKPLGPGEGLEIEDGDGLCGGLLAAMALEKASLSTSLAAFGTDCFTLAAPGLEVEVFSFDALAFIS